MILTLALDGGEWSVSHPSHFTLRERAPNTHWIRDWVDPTAGLDAVLKRKKILSLFMSVFNILKFNECAWAFV
jgi:hypothetical protein